MRKLILLALALTLIALTPPAPASASYCLAQCDSARQQCLGYCADSGWPPGCRMECLNQYRYCEGTCYCYGCPG
jgi:hypothetical protein